MKSFLSFLRKTDSLLETERSQNSSTRPILVKKNMVMASYRPLNRISIKSPKGERWQRGIYCLLLSSSIWSSITLLRTEKTTAQTAPIACPAGLSGVYSTWVRTGTTNTGTGTFTTAAGQIATQPNFTWSVTGKIDSTTIGSSEIFNGSNTIETIYGQADSASNLNIRVQANDVTAGQPIRRSTLKTIRFNSPTKPGLGFAVTDIDVDQVRFRAKDANGVDVPIATIASWFIQRFDADTSGGTQLPFWDPAEAAVIGSSANNQTWNTTTQSNVLDTEASAAWFQPNIPLTELTMEYQSLGNTNVPSYHAFIASCVEPIAPNLTVTKSDGGASFIQGGNGTYTITPRNSGTAPTTGTVTITDTLPPELTYSSATGTGWTFNYNSTTRVFTATSIIPIAANSNGNPITLNVTASSGAGTTITNTANISGGNEPAANNGNNTGSDTTPIIGSDYSDAPTTGTAPNGTGTNSYGNAIHNIVPTLKLGAVIDNETVSLASATADGDDTNGNDDEDGITLPSLTAGATSYTIPAANINVTNTSGGTATLHAWVDFDKNGTFEASEYTSTTVNTGTSGGNPTAALSWSGITAGAAGNTFARFRLTTDSSVTPSTPSGNATSGEVEDYQVAIAFNGSALMCPTELLGNWSNNTNVTPNRNELYKINPSNGAVITPKIADTNRTSGSGVDPTGQYLFYVDRTFTPNKVRRLDLVTGNDIDTGYTVPVTGVRVAVHPTDGNLYVLNGSSTGSSTPITLYKAPYASVPVTAGTAMTTVGNLTNDPDNGSTNDIGLISGGDIAFDKLGNLYLIEQGRRVFSINSSLKAVYLNTLTVSGLTPSPAGLAFVGDKLYAADSASPGNLYVLNLVDNSIEIKGAAGIPILSPGAAHWGDLASCQYPKPDIVATKTVAKVGGTGTTIQPGDILEYTITVRNQSQIYAVDVRFSDAIPANTTYVAGSTTVNYNAGTATDFEAVADASGVMPFAVSGGAEIKTFGRSPGVLQPDDDTTINAEAVIKFQVKVDTTNPPTQVSNQGTVSYPNPSTGVNETINTDDPSTPTVPNDPTVVPVQSSVASNPNVLLVKRITSVNGTFTNNGINLDVYDPDPTYPYDKNVIQPGLTPSSSTNWPGTTGAATSTFLLGARDGGTTKPNDEVEYTIYFLSTGTGIAKNVTICDRVPRYQTFIPESFNNLISAPNTAPTAPPDNRGIQISQGTTTYGYTNMSDGDAAQYYPPGALLPSACTQPPLLEDNGAIVVNLGDVINATAPGDPVNSYGFIRFRAKVK